VSEFVDNLWGLYREEARKQITLRKAHEEGKTHPYDAIDRITQDGIVKGILDSLKTIEGKDVFMKAYEINCELAGINLETGFGFWETVKKPPKKDGWYLVTLKGEIAGEEKDFVGMEHFNGSEWDSEIIAWMPLPEPSERDD